MPKLTPLLTPDQINRSMGLRGGLLSGTQAKIAAQIKIRFELDLRRKGLEKAVANMNFRALRTAGAAMMRIMKTSMRSVDDKANPKVSTVNFPPLAHRQVGEKLKRRIFFALEGGNNPHSVVIGPQPAPGSLAPRALEYGGVSYMTKKVRVTAKGLPYRRTGKKRGNLSPAQKAKIKSYYKSITVHQTKIRIYVQKRPYARTALTRVLRRVPRFWYNMLKAV